ncbi:putative pterin-4-alpha-carbinolamine dehydratase [Luteitalea sp. TBR-22]|uniref:4a-hydroxytetrahydrobiopterin dehydratase n=1 Tax=Luteitalea sp. TBR-22 TaxID=2802971 RepID=UPI001AF0C51A|nr:4a-hydroxytetrahydrobiopterin dehydratase [Luteitalea sp. TBR-22]BCS35838.1 putative pterin-4-alpha-carbinolamine dehydratase [Luteitalea sp. TBR-22]
MSDHLDPAQLAAALADLPGWTSKGNAIERQFTITSFPDAIALLTRLAFQAEAVDHHPDFVLEYRRLTVRYWTHTAGGVTQKDVDAAHAADRLCAQYAVFEK